MARYDGSEDAKHAIERAGSLFSGRHALILTIWQPTAGLGSFAWAGATARVVNFFEFDRAAGEEGGEIAEQGLRIAREAGLQAERSRSRPPDLSEDNHRDRGAASRRNHRHGLRRAHWPVLDAAGKRLHRCRPSCTAAHPGHPSAQRPHRHGVA